MFFIEVSFLTSQCLKKIYVIHTNLKKAGKNRRTSQGGTCVRETGGWRHAVEEEPIEGPTWGCCMLAEEGEIKPECRLLMLVRRLCRAHSSIVQGSVCAFTG